MMEHKKFMERCFELALQGLGNVAPNPLVGCVIVVDNEIVAEGYHAQFGEDHAEVAAIKNLKDKSLLKHATLYVNLEPCAHQGKTPPCANTIIEHNIPRVVIAMRDPFEKVNGLGVQMLQNAGIEVTTGILEDEAKHLNRRFICSVQNKRPWIILKWAQSKDQFIDPPRQDDERGIFWLTGPESKIVSHQQRSEEQAILVGKNTVIVDDPLLTVREVEGKNPLRIIIDPDLEIQPNARLLNDGLPTLVFNIMNDMKTGAVEYISYGYEKVIPQILETLNERGIQSLIIEGGRYTLQSFVDSGMWDEARIFTGDVQLSEGLKAPEFNGKMIEWKKCGNDMLQIYLNQ